MRSVTPVYSGGEGQMKNPGSKLRALAGRTFSKPDEHDEAEVDIVEPDPLRRRVDRLTLETLLAESTRNAEIVFAMIEIDCLHPNLDLLSFESPSVLSEVDAETMLEIADTIAENVRPCDVIYRTNTNEYGVFLDSVTMEEAANVSARVGTAVNALFPPDDSRAYSVSIGLADSPAVEANGLIDQARLDLRARQHDNR